MLQAEAGAPHARTPLIAANITQMSRNIRCTGRTAKICLSVKVLVADKVNKEYQNNLTLALKNQNKVNLPEFSGEN